MAKDRKNNNNDDHKMTREEAGRLGGNAPHECRGRACNEDNNGNDRKSASSKNKNNNKNEDKGWFSSMFGDDDND